MSTKVILKPRKDEPLRRFHPWVFSGAIKTVKGEPQDGDVVEVYSNDGQFLATGHFQQGSITVRVFSFAPVEDPDLFWYQKLSAALAYRKSLGLAAKEAESVTNAFRLVHAEGDGLPGLILDVYGKTAVLQCHSIGMHREKERIAHALRQVFQGEIEAIYDKSQETLPAKYAATVKNASLYGAGSSNIVLENGHSFFVNWETGQKTGFFLDQRDNRLLLARYVKNKSVLNTFCYSGGFSVYALAAGARHVQSVDVSQKAIEWTNRNALLALEGLMNPPRHESFAMDVMPFLKDCPCFDVVVVDPPAFAKSLDKRHNAVQGYKRLNVAALKKVAPGGMLFTFSCSQVVDRELFYHTIVAAAIEAGRQVRVMHHLSQPPDHPVSLFHPEGAYLKGLALYVE
jgi:23S rRNA (cytosine1962-C5)-methyltransferase